ncbi:hypothetical protein DFJ74DRAFT_700972 [Hyaloraphidium curvatum]|nr:hypothetical protein DFJ74DRAFT_700972 [Hyaloraphidium curvatum]
MAASTPPLPALNANTPPITYCIDRRQLMLPRACGWCGKEVRGLKSCGRCKMVAYCGAECQRADWQRHKAVCGLWVRALDFVFAALARPFDLYADGHFSTGSTRPLCPVINLFPSHGSGTGPTIKICSVFFGGANEFLYTYAVHDHPLRLALGLGEDCIGSIRSISASTDWACFPGPTNSYMAAIHSKEGLPGGRLKKINGVRAHDDKVISREVLPAPKLSAPQDLMVLRALPLAKAPKEPKKKRSAWSFFNCGQGEPNRWFARTGDGISTVLCATVESEASPLGLPKDTRVDVVQLNETPGICRVLGAGGWKLVQLPDHVLARCLMKRGSICGACLEIMANQAWPKEQRSMERVIKQCVPTAPWHDTNLVPGA